MKTIDDAPFLDIFSEEFQADAASVIDRVRDASWLVRTPVGGLVIGREHVQSLMADRRLHSHDPIAIPPMKSASTSVCA